MLNETDTTTSREKTIEDGHYADEGKKKGTQYSAGGRGEARGIDMQMREWEESMRIHR